MDDLLQHAQDAMDVANVLADGVQLSDVPKLLVIAAPLLTNILKRNEVTDEDRATAAAIRLHNRLRSDSK